MSDKSVDEIIADIIAIICLTAVVVGIIYVICIGIALYSTQSYSIHPTYPTLKSLQDLPFNLHIVTVRPIIIPAYDSSSVEELADTVNDLRWRIPYTEGSFECGEMAACLERYLEREGWHTYIAVGKPPFDRSSRTKHAWLLVETSDGYIPVEPTAPKVIPPSNPYYDNYFRYKYLFETPYEAELHFPGEFDFWNVGRR